jgi:RNA polymerase sigma-70 factor (ECF subfamily)
MEETIMPANSSDESAHRRLIEKYSTTVYRLGLSYLGNREDAEDIMQEVFLRYLRKPRSFASEEHEKAWFIRVAINCCKSFINSAWKRKIVPFEELGNQPAPEEADGSGTSVYEAVMALPPKQRMCIHLYYYEELSISEISKLTGIRESTVKSHLFRARASLEQKLKGDYFSE